MRDGFVSMGHGRALVNVEDPEAQLKIYKKIIAQGLSVRATEAEVKKNLRPHKREKQMLHPFPMPLKLLIA